MSNHSTKQYTVTFTYNITVPHNRYLNMQTADEKPNAWNDRKAVDCRMLNNIRFSSFFVGFRPFINRVNYEMKIHFNNFFFNYYV